MLEKVSLRERTRLEQLVEVCVLNREPLIVAAIPAFNEEATLSKVVQQAQKYVGRVIVCDDGSVDTTSKIASALGATVLRHKTNLGKGVALHTLFTKAREMGADIIVTLDADGQHDPVEIPSLVKAMETCHADIVVGSRFIEGNNGNNQIPRYRILGNKVLSMITDRRITDTQSGFRVYNKAAINSLIPMEAGMGVDSELLIKARETGLRIVEVPIKVSYNVPKSSKHNALLQSGQVILSIAKYWFTRRSLFFLGFLGLNMLLVALGLWIGLFQMFAETGEIIANVSLVAILVAVIGFAQIIAAILVRRKL
jgi:glycosyltransferase involved in cell wall biosynthesis